MTVSVLEIKGRVTPRSSFRMRTAPGHFQGISGHLRVETSAAMGLRGRGWAVSPRPFKKRPPPQSRFQFCPELLLFISRRQTMGIRGPKSAADLASPAVADLRGDARPKPPEDLIEEQADEWRAVVARLPAGWFGPGDVLAG